MTKYKVGYGRPPKKHQFKKGQSGNPNGRPKKTSRPIVDALSILKRQVKVSRQGVEQKMCTTEVALRQLVKRAITEGHRASIKKLIKEFKKYHLLKDLRPTPQGGVLVMPHSFFNADPETQERMLAEHILNKGHSKADTSSKQPRHKPEAFDTKSILERIIKETHVIERDGKQVRITVLEVFLNKVAQQARAGDPIDIEVYENLTSYLGGGKATERRAGYLVAPPQVSLEEWLAQVKQVHGNSPNPNFKTEPD